MSRDYGYEVDLTATYKITNNLSYMLGAGYLFTGEYYKGATCDCNEVQEQLHGHQQADADLLAAVRCCSKISMYPRKGNLPGIFCLMPVTFLWLILLAALPVSSELPAGAVFLIVKNFS